MSDELKPCPFCGNEPAPYWKGVGCATSGCLLNGLHLDADKWNRRAQPAEAEGVDFGFDDRSVKVSQEAYSIFMERERDHLAALSAVTAERDRLREALEDLLGCPADIVQATVPKAGIDAAPPYQVVLDVSISLTRWNKAKAAMAAKEA